MYKRHTQINAVNQSLTTHLQPGTHLHRHPICLSRHTSCTTLDTHTHTHTQTQAQDKHTVTLRHTVHIQGDFGCRATDGEAAALVQPALTRCDSRLVCHGTLAVQGPLVLTTLLAEVRCLAAGLLPLPQELFNLQNNGAPRKCAVSPVRNTARPDYLCYELCVLISTFILWEISSFITTHFLILLIRKQSLNVLPVLKSQREHNCTGCCWYLPSN